MSAEGRRMAGEPLLSAAHLRKASAPGLLVAFLLGDELLQRTNVDEPQSLDEFAIDELGARQARDVIGCEVHNASGVARADVGDAANDDGAR